MYFYISRLLLGKNANKQDLRQHCVRLTIFQPKICLLHRLQWTAGCVGNALRAKTPRTRAVCGDNGGRIAVYSLSKVFVLRLKTFKRCCQLAYGLTKLGIVNLPKRK